MPFAKRTLQNQEIILQLQKTIYVSGSTLKKQPDNLNISTLRKYYNFNFEYKLLDQPVKNLTAVALKS